MSNLTNSFVFLFSSNFLRVVKPVGADDHEHHMVYNKQGVIDAQQKLGSCILQKYFFHDSIIFKVFVVGDSINVVRRPSLEDSEIQEKLKADKINFELVPRISKPKEGFNLKCESIEDPPVELLKGVCKEINKTFVNTIQN